MRQLVNHLGHEVSAAPCGVGGTLSTSAVCRSSLSTRVRVCHNNPAAAAECWFCETVRTVQTVLEQISGRWVNGAAWLQPAKHHRRNWLPRAALLVMQQGSIWFQSVALHQVHACTCWAQLGARHLNPDSGCSNPANYVCWPMNRYITEFSNLTLHFLLANVCGDDCQAKGCLIATAKSLHDKVVARRLLRRERIVHRNLRVMTSWSCSNSSSLIGQLWSGLSRQPWLCTKAKNYVFLTSMTRG